MLHRFDTGLLRLTSDRGLALRAAQTNKSALGYQLARRLRDARRTAALRAGGIRAPATL
jgi:hypothetical protein